MKKVIFIVIIVLIAGAAGYFLLNKTQNSAPSPQPQENKNNPPPLQPQPSAFQKHQQTETTEVAQSFKSKLGKIQSAKPASVSALPKEISALIPGDAVQISVEAVTYVNSKSGYLILFSQEQNLPQVYSSYDNILANWTSKDGKEMSTVSGIEAQDSQYLLKAYFSSLENTQNKTQIIISIQNK